MKNACFESREDDTFVYRRSSDSQIYDFDFCVNFKSNMTKRQRIALLFSSDRVRDGTPAAASLSYIPVNLFVWLPPTLSGVGGSHTEVNTSSTRIQWSHSVHYACHRITLRMLDYPTNVAPT